MINAPAHTEQLQFEVKHLTDELNMKNDICTRLQAQLSAQKQKIAMLEELLELRLQDRADLVAGVF